MKFTRLRESVPDWNETVRILMKLLFASALAGCAGGEVAPDRTAGGRYPARWWEPAPEADKPWWEILPQAAGPGEVILSKRNELGLLSNFAATPFELDGVRYASLEGFWQCMKYPEGEDDPRWAVDDWPYTRAEVRALVAFEAHQAGVEAEARMEQMGIDWISYEGERIRFKGSDAPRHLALIERATRAKVAQNPEVERVLRATGDLVLKPDHLQEDDATPAWRYFEIYMRVRAELPPE